SQIGGESREGALTPNNESPQQHQHHHSNVSSDAMVAVMAAVAAVNGSSAGVARSSPPPPSQFSQLSIGNSLLELGSYSSGAGGYGAGVQNSSSHNSMQSHCHLLGARNSSSGGSPPASLSNSFPFGSSANWFNSGSMETPAAQQQGSTLFDLSAGGGGASANSNQFLRSSSMFFAPTTGSSFSAYQTQMNPEQHCGEALATIHHQNSACMKNVTDFFETDTEESILKQARKHLYQHHDISHESPPVDYSSHQQ
ncbi:hypothetical protein Ciccas_013049, partial [Cichlidogyrus casuarinus]